MVTSRPTGTHTVPSPITVIQCHRDQGSRTSRAGTFVVTVPVFDSVGSDAHHRVPGAPYGEQPLAAARGMLRE
ncbi:hypothetical protein [Streptomyces sp. NPDC058613]|uniref:hypothetical protein n=1 Tax=unclassified Streptomyces TaxID=2593676 RepID=UPI0036637540